MNTCCPVQIRTAREGLLFVTGFLFYDHECNGRAVKWKQAQNIYSIFPNQSFSSSHGVERAEQQQMKRRKEVGGWIREVEDMEKEVNEILRRGDQKSRKDVSDAVQELLVQLQDWEGTDMLPRPPVDELPMEEIVGSELTYDRICSCDLGCGVKTVQHWKKFKEVIWNKLQIPRDIWEIRSTKEEKAVEILRSSENKEVVLLLDDIWERLDLLEIGVPHLDAQNKSKIVFTTRSQDVCHQMKAHKSIEVVCLSSEAAWTLFQKEVGEETLKSHPHILRLANIVAEECKGLPLALITLGRAMVGEKDPSNWEKELISGLVSLKLFSICNTNVLSGVEESLLDELESLNYINDIDIKIKVEGEGEGTEMDVTLPNYIAARENYFYALHEGNFSSLVHELALISSSFCPLLHSELGLVLAVVATAGFDLLYIDCAALFPCPWYLGESWIVFLAYWSEFLICSVTVA
ncbi:putative disease resistance protein [Vitis vinifera]|uniref:Putative disease resistance protein n=1 Tax=Vitis vinifera TaxID=29760 RepID=A0A438G7X8_VITVI|nr:putative disease resistance protein [Vitis vinifera]